MKRFLFSLTILFCTTGHVSAGFVNNYPEWQRMTAAEQGIYLSGIYDQIVTKNPFSRRGILATIDGLQTCVQELELETDEMVKAISGWYEENPDKWSLPPKTVFHASIISTTCKQYIVDAHDQDLVKPDKDELSD